MKILILVLFFLSSCYRDHDKFQQSDLEKIERILNFPSEVGDLNKYHRYCFVNKIELNCIYVNEGQKKFTLIKKFSDMPEILDGGCDIINLKYKLIEDKIDHLFCNGDA